MYVLFLNRVLAGLVEIFPHCVAELVPILLVLVTGRRVERTEIVPEVVADMLEHLRILEVPWLSTYLNSLHRRLRGLI